MTVSVIKDSFGFRVLVPKLLSEDKLWVGFQSHPAAQKESRRLFGIGVIMFMKCLLHTPVWVGD